MHWACNRSLAPLNSTRHETHPTQTLKCIESQSSSKPHSPAVMRFECPVQSGFQSIAGDMSCWSKFPVPTSTNNATLTHDSASLGFIFPTYKIKGKLYFYFKLLRGRKGAITNAKSLILVLVYTMHGKITLLLNLFYSKLCERKSNIFIS